MKKIIAILAILAAACIAETDGKFYKLTFCTTVHGIDYCNEHDANVKFHFDGKNIKVTRYGHPVYDMTVVGKWTTDKDNGVRTAKVKYDGSYWTIQERSGSYRMTDGHCASVEFWNGTRESQRRSHGYIRTDVDDMFAFTDRCEASEGRRSVKAKRYTVEPVALLN